MRSVDTLFRPMQLGNLALPNRIAMAPMTRSFSPGGVPGADVAAYYRRRAEGGTGLIITEGVAIPHAVAVFDPAVPRLAGEAVLAGWRHVTSEVHAGGGTKIFAQLWHMGTQNSSGITPEGMVAVGSDMSLSEVELVIAAYGEAAANAQSVGFDGVELHGAHGYLIDQFLWDKKNRRTDQYGGSTMARARFGADVIAEVRRRVSPNFPIVMRFSQFKVEDYQAQIAKTPGELDRILTVWVEAGVTALHASMRRFWEPAFAGSELTFPGWVKKLTGLPTIGVGSVTLGTDVMTSFGTDDAAATTDLDALLDRMERDEFDMIAVGRALIANADWAEKVRRGEPLQPFARPLLATLA
jgi:2,4-dienoyl-CoA reductase-like NADH-dependent reductase (Old Yellow Enzyme family)